MGNIFVSPFFFFSKKFWNPYFTRLLDTIQIISIFSPRLAEPSILGKKKLENHINIDNFYMLLCINAKLGSKLGYKPGPHRRSIQLIN